MNSLLKLTATATMAMALATNVHAARGVSEMANICKEGVEDHFAAEQPSRIKFKGISGPRSAKQVRLQVFPSEGEVFDATCQLNTKTGEIVSVNRQS